MTPQADAVISVGNANEMIALPQMSRVIGELKSAETLAGGFIGCVSASEGLSVELQAIIGATCQLGYGLLTARLY
jgi:glycine reductase